MSVEPTRHLVTADEFEALAAISENRLELLEGEIFDMALTARCTPQSWIA